MFSLYTAICIFACGNIYSLVACQPDLYFSSYIGLAIAVYLHDKGITQRPLE